MRGTIGSMKQGWILVGILAAAIPLTAGPAGGWTLESAAVSTSNGATVLQFKGGDPEGALPHDVFCLQDPWRVVVDLFGADAPAEADGAAAIASAAGPVIDVRWSLWRSDPAASIVRYVLEFGGPVAYSVQEGAGELRINVEPGTAPPVDAAPRPELGAQENGEPDGSVRTGTAAVAMTAAAASGAVPATPDLSPAGPLPENCEAVPFVTVTETCAPQAVAPAPVRAAQAGSAATAPDLARTPQGAAGLPQDAAPPLGEVDAAAAPSGALAFTAPPVGTTGVVAPPPGAVYTPAPPALAGELFAAAQEETARDRGRAVPLEGAARTRPMNLDVQGADIRTVLRSVAEYGDANIVADRDVEGPVTVRLVQVPWRQALDIVCASAGLVAIDGGQVIRVATAQTWQQEGIDREAAARKREDLEPLITRVFDVRFAAAKELLTSISFALSKRGSASVDERTNTILVSDIGSRQEEVERLITSLDTVTRQVEIVARMVDVDATTARQFGINWSLRNLHSNSERLSGSVGLTEPLSSSSGNLRLGVVRDFGNLDATIEALERDNKAKLISNPKITTISNRKARILVGKEVPLIVMDEAGNATTELKRVGITLEVTPQINDEDRITLDLHPEVSDLSSQATVQGGVVFNTTLADTRVMVNDGETAVIGGLVRTSETDFEQGIPVLRSIPILGALFRSSDTRTESRELLIFVTPRIVEGLADNR